MNSAKGPVAISADGPSSAIIGVEPHLPDRTNLQVCPQGPMPKWPVWMFSVKSD